MNAEVIFGLVWVIGFTLLIFIGWLCAILPKNSFLPPKYIFTAGLGAIWSFIIIPGLVLIDVNLGFVGVGAFAFLVVFRASVES